MPTMSKAKRAEQEAERVEALERLREEIKPGDTVWTILRHASRDGMSRAISPVIVHPYRDRWERTFMRPWDITWLVARATGDKVHQRHGGIIIGGYGMDWGFHLVYSLSRTMFADGFDCIGEGCPANDHVNIRRGEPMPDRHRDGGYALRHEWL